MPSFLSRKDSTWTLLFNEKYNIKPLVVQFDHGFMRLIYEKITSGPFASLELKSTVSAQLAGRKASHARGLDSQGRFLLAATPIFTPCGLR